uniref:Cytochrome P450 314A1 n=1 Tax=Paracyclopina nana TaxID=565004 RepID=A0A0F7J1S1_PARNA|nr:cytochrome P450 314A1 [Paracyclopina nana]
MYWVVMMIISELVKYVKWLYCQLLQRSFIIRTSLIDAKKKNTQIGEEAQPATPIPGPFSLPILGASWLYSWFGPYSHENYHVSNFDKFAKYGAVVREEVLWNYPLIHLFDADDIEKILRYKSDYPYRPHNEADVYYRKYRSDLYANIGMVNENGPAWSHLRKHLSPPLTNRKTPYHYAANMNQIAEDLVAVVHQQVALFGGVLTGISPLVYKASLEMMCNVALERRMGFLNPDQQQMSQDMIKIMNALKGYQTASSQAMYGLPLWKYLPVCLSGVFTKLVEYKDTLFYTIGGLVDESFAASSMDEMSILGQLLKNKALPLQEIKVSCVDYITAGVDTVGNSLIYAIWLIGNDPRVQAKLRAELSPYRFCTMSPECLQNLPYLRACIKESFRMFPTASQIARLTEEKMEVSGGHVLPPHTVVLCHTHVASRQEQNFTRGNEFIPERWIAEERDSSWNHRSGLVMPFGCGKRICPGKRLAEQEIYILAAKLFVNFQLTAIDPLQIEFNWLMSPMEPMRFKVDVIEQ